MGINCGSGATGVINICVCSKTANLILLIKGGVLECLFHMQSSKNSPISLMFHP